MGEVDTQATIFTTRRGIDVPDWRAAVYAAVQPLVGAGAASEGYARRCVLIVEEHGPYMVLAPGIALAHARPEDGAKCLGLCAALLSRPVDFGHPENDPVDVIFAFTAPDAESHTGLLAALAQALSAGLAERLRSADTDASVCALLAKEVSPDA